MKNKPGSLAKRLRRHPEPTTLVKTKDGYTVPDIPLKQISPAFSAPRWAAPLFGPCGNFRIDEVAIRLLPDMDEESAVTSVRLEVHRAWQNAHRAVVTHRAKVLALENIKEK